MKNPSGKTNSVGSRATSVKLPTKIHLHASGMRSTVKTVDEALALIDRELAPELARLSRWAFARALLTEAQATGKSNDVVAAYRQFRQALINEKWLVEK